MIHGDVAYIWKQATETIRVVFLLYNIRPRMVAISCRTSALSTVDCTNVQVPQCFLSSRSLFQSRFSQLFHRFEIKGRYSSIEHSHSHLLILFLSFKPAKKAEKIEIEIEFPKREKWWEPGRKRCEIARVGAWTATIRGRHTILTIDQDT